MDFILEWNFFLWHQPTLLFSAGDQCTICQYNICYANVLPTATAYQQLILYVMSDGTLWLYKCNKAIPDGGVAPHHLLRFRLSHMIWFQRREKCKGFSKGMLVGLCSGGSTYAPLARRSVCLVQKSISLVIFHLKLSKLF